MMFALAGTMSPMLAAGQGASDFPGWKWSGEWLWFSFGLAGNFIFGSRFFLQWIHSERHKESRIPVSFWWLSVVGTLVLFAYFCHRRQWIALLGNGPQLIPYARNLVLIYRKKREGKSPGFEAAELPETSRIL